MSEVMENWVAALLSLVAVSWALLAGISTVTLPEGEVISKVYTVDEVALKLPLVPLPTVISVRSKPVTASSKVTVIFRVVALLGLDWVEVMVGVGLALS